MKKRIIRQLLSVVLTLAMFAGQTGVASATEELPVVTAGEDASYETSDEDSSEKASSEASDESSSEVSAEDAGKDNDDASSTGDGGEDESATDDSTDAASEDVPAEDEADASDSASSADSKEEEPEIIEEFPEGLVGMSAGYELNAIEKELRKDSLSHNVLSSFKGMEEGVDYEKDMVITIAPNKEHAKEIAAAYGGELDSFEYGIAAISLKNSELSVEDAFRYSLNEDYNLPPVSPNYYTEFEEPVFSDGVEGLSGGSFSLSDGYDWEKWYYDLYNPDPALNPSAADFQWVHEAIGTYDAWAITQGAGITVAVIDSGCNISHEDLDDNVITDRYNPGEQGNVDIVGHGTHVCGIIGAEMDNALGGCGVAPEVRIMPISVATPNGGVDSTLEFRAMAYVAGVDEYESIDEETGEWHFSGRRADIANMSIGGPIYDPIQKKCVDALYEAGVTFVASMGNNSVNAAFYPACLDHVIGVVASDYNGQNASFTNFNYRADIAAPGVDIYSTYKGDDNRQFKYMGGTSMASPVVAGVCALYMSAYGHTDPDTMLRVLQESATKSSSSGAGAGIVNVSKIFKKDVTAPEISISVKNEKNETLVLGSASDGKTVTLTGDIPGAAKINLKSDYFNGDYSANSNSGIIYTINGTTPKVSGDEVINGNLCRREKSEKLTDILGEDARKVTVKAICVNNMGVISPVTTLIFNYVPDKITVEKEERTLTILNAPQKIVAGKSVTLSATVTPEYVSQKVIWKITGGDMSKAKIDAKGKLSTNAGQTGLIEVTCSTVEGDAFDSVEIEVVNDVSPVKTMKFNKSTYSLTYNAETSSVAVGDIYLTELKDTGNNDRIISKDLELLWSSSNENVVELLKDFPGLSYEAMAFRAKSVGTATITCMALDGSGKKATCKVTVTSEGKIVNSVSYVDPDDHTTPKSSGSIYAGSSVTVEAKQFGKSGSQLGAVAEPVWSIDKPSVASFKIENSANPAEEKGSSVIVTGRSKGTAKLTCAARDGSGKKAVFTIKVMQQVTKIELSGSNYISKGATATFKAVVNPSNADNKNLKWYVVDEYSNVVPEITVVGGKVKVPADFAGESPIYSVMAAVKDGPYVYGIKDFKVTNKATRIEPIVDTEDKGFTVAVGDTINLRTRADNNTVLKWSVSSVKNAEIKDTDDGAGLEPSDPQFGYNWVTLKALSKGSVKVTATADDQSGKKVSVTVKIVQQANDIVINGQSFIAKGTTSGKYTATVLPKNTDNKKVYWRIADNGDGINDVETNGSAVIVRENCTAKSFRLIAQSQDKGGYQAERVIYIKDAKMSEVSIITDEDAPIYKPVFDKKTGALKSAQLSDTEIDYSGTGNPNESSVGSAKELQLISRIVDQNGSTNYGKNVIWQSSNEKVARVDSTGKVYAVSKGTCTVTAAADDGTGKKASVKITVITPASGVYLHVKNNQKNIIGYGKSATVDATVGNTYGKPGTSKVKWDYEIIESGGLYRVDNPGTSNEMYVLVRNVEESISDAEVAKTLKDKKILFTMSNGKVTVNSKTNFQKNMSRYYSYFNHIDDYVYDRYGEIYSNESYYEGDVFYQYITRPAIRVKATTTDGTEYSKTMCFTASLPTTYIRFGSNPYRSAPKITIEVSDDDPYFDWGCPITSDNSTGFTIVSSNPDILTADASARYLALYPRYYQNGKTGSVKVTLTANDGSGKKASVTVIVKKKK